MRTQSIQDCLFQTLSQLVQCATPAAADAVTRLMHSLEGRKPRTLCAIESDLRVWLKWWTETEQTGNPGNACLIALFIEQLRAQGKKSTTIARAAYTIKRVFAVLDWLDTKALNVLSVALKGSYEANERRRWKGPERVPFTWDRIQECIAVVDLGKRVEVRGMAALLVMYDAMAGADDVFGYQRGPDWHLEPSKRADLVRLPDGTGLLALNGQDSVKRTNLSKLTMQWLDWSGIYQRNPGEALFSTTSGKPWSRSGWESVMKRIVARAGFDPRLFSTVSPRLGGARDMLSAGSSVLDVCRQGDWRRPDMVIRVMERQGSLVSGHYVGPVAGRTAFSRNTSAKPRAPINGQILLPLQYGLPLEVTA